LRFSKPWNQAAPKLKDERDGRAELRAQIACKPIGY
jgi:hypothetical protein